MRKWLAALCALMMLMPAFRAKGEETAVNDRNRVFYEIFTGSFSDSDGDGIGDLRGILNRMDHLAGLGIEGIWLTPVYPSASYHKYDADDYTAVDPAFGTEEDLLSLVEACHERGMLLILDLPINHTSRSHPWFTAFAEARKTGDPESEYYNWYVCVGEGEQTSGHIYYPLEGTELYYEGNFSPNMPELNYDNPLVRKAVTEVAKYWLDRGVDGFRFDAAKYLYLGDNEKTAAFWREYMAKLREIRPEIWVVAEVWDADAVTEVYSDAMSCFDFTVSGAEGMLAAAARGGSVGKYTAYVEAYLAKMESLGGKGLYVPFLSNHDMDRAAGYATVSNGRAHMAANLYILGPGAPFIYYGEEIGLKGSRGGANTDANRRLAMRWGDGDTVKDPVGADYDAEKQTAATGESMGEEGSLASYYANLIRIRKAYPEMYTGTYRSVAPEGSKAGGFLAEGADREVLVMHNTGTRAAEVDLKAPGLDRFTSVDISVGMGTATVNDGILRLDKQTTAILTVTKE